MTWRLSAGKEHGCGRRDRSPCKSPASRLLGKSALQKRKVHLCEAPIQWDDDPQGIDRSVNSAARHRLAKMTWRRFAGNVDSCGRRDRSPKSGVETLGKSATQKAKRTCGGGLHSGTTTANALPCRLQIVSFHLNSIARFVKNDYYRRVSSLAF